MTTLHIPQPVVSDRESTTRVDGRQGIVEIVWRSGVLDELRSHAGATYVSRSGRGLDAGGVLLGFREGEKLVVSTWRPIPRGKDATSHFYLDTNEEQGLSRLLKSFPAEPSLSGLEVVGWFRSRTKGEPEFEDHDRKFQDQHFGTAVHLAVVLRPSHQRPTAAAIYVRNRDGEMVGTPVTTLNLAARSVESALPESGEIPGVSLEDAPAPARKAGTVFLWAAFLATAVLMTLGAILMLERNATHAVASAQPESIGFELVIDSEGLKARWNPSAPLVNSADTAQLLLGGERLQLSHAELAQGFLRVPMKKEGLTGDTEISLKIGNYEEVAQIITAAR